jgi:hypothetical protein
MKGMTKTKILFLFIALSPIKPDGGESATSQLYRSKAN